ncbi:MAG: ABC transporter ATP-binding protein [Ruthenibacterium sp.]
MEHAIVLKNLCKNYKDFSLKNINFSVPKGCIMGFIGENGAGKTTTLKAILGLIHIDGGSVEVLGKNPFTQRREINTDIGAVLDNSFFYEGMRTKDISSVMAKLHPAWDSALFVRYCERFALPAAKSIKEYSKGMKAKLSLATALSHHPKLLILDEATSGLDPVVRNEFLDIFMEFIEDEEHTILLSSHITSDLEKIADYITFIHDGEIVFSETKDDMMECYGVVKCAKADAALLPAELIIGRRESKFDIELLVKNKSKVQAAHPDFLLESASIDDIMTFFAHKGAYDA